MKLEVGAVYQLQHQEYRGMIQHYWCCFVAPYRVNLFYLESGNRLIDGNYDPENFPETHYDMTKVADSLEEFFKNQISSS